MPAAILYSGGGTIKSDTRLSHTSSTMTLTFWMTRVNKSRKGVSGAGDGVDDIVRSGRARPTDQRRGVEVKHFGAQLVLRGGTAITHHVDRGTRDGGRLLD